MANEPVLCKRICVSTAFNMAEAVLRCLWSHLRFRFTHTHICRSASIRSLIWMPCLLWNHVRRTFLKRRGLVQVVLVLVYLHVFESSYRYTMSAYLGIGDPIRFCVFLTSRVLDKQSRLAVEIFQEWGSGFRTNGLPPCYLMTRHNLSFVDR